MILPFLANHLSYFKFNKHGGWHCGIASNTAACALVLLQTQIPADSLQEATSVWKTWMKLLATGCGLAALAI